MAETAGKNGAITFSGITVGVKDWSLSWVADPLETTDFGDSGNRTYIVGLKGWTAAATANFDATNTADVGDTATATFTVTSGTVFSGICYITGMDISEPVDGIVEVTYSFQGSGALTPPS